MSSRPDKTDLWQTRETLLLRIKSRSDDQAWDDFESYYRRYLYNILRKMKISPVDAEDILQLVLVKMWEKLPDFNHDSNRGKFRSWLATVVRNQALDYLRRNKRHNHEELPDFKLESSQTDLEKIIEYEWQRSIMEQAWEIVKEEFEENTLAAFELSSSGMSIDSIAEKLGLTESSVYSFRRRVKERLKDEIRRLNYEFG